MRTSLVYLAASFCLLAPGAADAQSEPAADARTMAAHVQGFYAARSTLELDFTQTYWSDAYGRTLRTSRGVMRVARPGRLRFDYTAPLGQVLVAVDDEVIHFEPGEDGEPGQYYRVETDVLSRVFGFLTGASSLEDDYRFALVEGSRRIPHTVCLELTLRRRDPQFLVVRLYVSDVAGAEGVIQGVSIETVDGDWNNFTFDGSRFDVPLDPATFEYTPPAGSRELRSPPS